MNPMIQELDAAWTELQKLQGEYFSKWRKEGNDEMQRLYALCAQSKKRLTAALQACQDYSQKNFRVG